MYHLFASSAYVKYTVFSWCVHLVFQELKKLIKEFQCYKFLLFRNSGIKFASVKKLDMALLSLMSYNKTIFYRIVTWKKSDKNIAHNYKTALTDSFKNCFKNPMVCQTLGYILHEIYVCLFCPSLYFQCCEPDQTQRRPLKIVVE